MELYYKVDEAEGRKCAKTDKEMSFPRMWMCLGGGISGLESTPVECCGQEVGAEEWVWCRDVKDQKMDALEGAYVCKGPEWRGRMSRWDFWRARVVRQWLILHAFLVVAQCPTPLLGKDFSSSLGVILWLGGPEQPLILTLSKISQKNKILFLAIFYKEKYGTKESLEGL